METNKITFWQLLQNYSIEIPIVQRDYAQGRVGKEYLRKNFLTSLKQALDGETLKLDFVYGSVENNTLQPLDGQQRLTTLWLLHWYIALFADKYKEAFNILSKFSYETRISSREFILNLCNSKNFKSFNKEEKDVVKFIKDATWYYSAWNQDPTISSMLRMIKGTDIGDKSGEDIIDGLEELFSNTGKDGFEKYWERLSATDAIVFYLQPLEDFGLSDDLYVKMNARGKQLTSFENLKADLIGYLREQERDSEQDEILNKRWKNLLDIRSGIPIKIDTEWTQLFWKNRSEDHRIDEIFFAFVNRLFWNELFTAVNDKGDYFLTLSSTSKNPSYEYFNTDDSDRYVGFDPYKYYMDSIPVSFFEKLKIILDNYSSFDGMIPSPRWMKGFDFIPTYRNNKNSKDEKKEISGINQLQRIIFFAVCKYFSEGVPNQQSLNRWMRVVYNLISGVDRTGSPEIRDVESVRKAISYLDTIDSHNAISSLAFKEKDVAEGSTSVLTRRWNEEIAKAFHINKNPNWENQIIEAEDYSFFHGSIRFLFQDEEGKTDWTMFDKKWNAVQRFFVRNENQSSVMNEGYHNTKLLKTLFSRFTTENFWKNLWWHYRTFNNKANTWMYYLLSPDLCSPVHYLLLEYPPCTLWAKSSPDDLAKNTLYLLTHTELLDYVRKRMCNSWIRNYSNHKAIYPSSTGVFLNASVRDEFLLNSDGIQVDDSAKIPGTPLLYGWDIDFRYKQHNFRWYRTDYVYLMDSNDGNVYVENNVEKMAEEEKYFCFKCDDCMTKEAILSRLDELIQKCPFKAESNEVTIQ